MFTLSMDSFEMVLKSDDFKNTQEQMRCHLRRVEEMGTNTIIANSNAEQANDFLNKIEALKLYTTIDIEQVECIRKLTIKLDKLIIKCLTQWYSDFGGKSLSSLFSICCCSNPINSFFFSSAVHYLTAKGIKYIASDYGLNLIASNLSGGNPRTNEVLSMYIVQRFLSRSLKYNDQMNDEGENVTLKNWLKNNIVYFKELMKEGKITQSIDYLKISIKECEKILKQGNKTQIYSIAGSGLGATLATFFKTESLLGSIVQKSALPLMSSFAIGRYGATLYGGENSRDDSDEFIEGIRKRPSVL